MSDQPTVEEFAEEARAFLDAHAELRVTDAKPFTWGDGDDDLSLFEEVDREAEQVQIAEAKRWRAARYDAGFGWITGPTEYGGRGLGKLPQRIGAQLA